MISPVPLLASLREHVQRPCSDGLCTRASYRHTDTRCLPITPAHDVRAAASATLNLQPFKCEQRCEQNSHKMFCLHHPRSSYEATLHRSYLAQTLRGTEPMTHGPKGGPRGATRLSARVPSCPGPRDLGLGGRTASQQPGEQMQNMRTVFSPGPRGLLATSTTQRARLPGRNSAALEASLLSIRQN